MLDGIVATKVESQLVLVPREGVLGFSSQIVPLLIPAIERSQGHTDIYHVIAKLLNGAMQLWISIRDDRVECAMVGYFINYDCMRVYSIPFLGGRARENWLRFEPEITAWAKANGASEFETYARKGWLRVLKGWTVSWIHIRKPL